MPDARHAGAAGPFSLDGRVALVTGGGSGIGRAIVEAFLDAGARVLAADLSRERLDALAAAIGDPRRLSTFAGDVSDPAAVDALFEAAQTGFGVPDIVCNNAGILDRMAPLDETDDALWNRVVAVNLTAPFLVTRRALPGMLARGRGAFVNTCSIASFLGGRAGCAYTATKHGILGLTRSVAAAYGTRGIRCNGVAPGSVRTAIAGDAPPSQTGWALRQKGLATRPPQAEGADIAPVAVFLASDAAAYLNGALVVADAGWTVY